MDGLTIMNDTFVDGPRIITINSKNGKRTATLTENGITRDLTEAEATAYLAKMGISGFGREMTDAEKAAFEASMKQLDVKMKKLDAYMKKLDKKLDEDMKKLEAGFNGRGFDPGFPFGSGSSFRNSSSSLLARLPPLDSAHKTLVRGMALVVVILDELPPPLQRLHPERALKVIQARRPLPLLQAARRRELQRNEELLLDRV